MLNLCSALCLEDRWTILLAGGHRKFLRAFLVGITQSPLLGEQCSQALVCRMARKCRGPRTLQSWVLVGLHDYPKKKEALASKRKCGRLVVKRHDFEFQFFHVTSCMTLSKVTSLCLKFLICEFDLIINRISVKTK